MRSDRIRRRDFIALLGAAAAQPLPVRANEPAGMRRIGVMLGGAEQDLDWQRLQAALEQELRALGWLPGRDLRIDYRWPGDGVDRINALAIELVERGQELIVTATLNGARAIRRRTEKVPIVFVNVADPVGGRLVPGLARPGGNITGFAGLQHSICPQWVEIVRQLAPRATRLGIVFNPEAEPEGGNFLAPLQAAVASSKIVAVSLPARTEGDCQREIEAFTRTPNGALLALPESSTVFHRTAIIEAAGKHKLPAIYPYRFCVAGGGLVSLGIDLVAQCKGAAGYVDRILRGEKPGDLPVQVPSKFELAINRKTAAELGIAVPPALLARADAVLG